MPYLIIVYDISVKRVNKIHKLLRQFLYWRQNSVFEGHLTDSEYAVLKSMLKETMEEDEDMVIVYKIKTEKYLDTELLGNEKSERGFVV